jgi:hypothetical protein
VHHRRSPPPIGGKPAELLAAPKECGGAQSAFLFPDQLHFFFLTDRRFGGEKEQE